MLYQFSDLLAVLAATDLMIVLVALGAVDNPLRALLGLAMTLLLPGYAITAALFPGESLERVKRLAVSVASSLGVAAMGGLLLNQTGPGLQTGSWALWFGGVTFAAAAVAAVRRFRTLSVSRPRPPFRLALPGAALLSLTAFLIAVALSLSIQPAPAEGLSGYSSLWMVPSKDATVGSVDLGLASGEFGLRNYKLQLLLNNRVVKEWPSITLRPGESWEATVQVPPGLGGRRLELDLYRLDAPTQIYRHTELTINGNGG